VKVALVYDPHDKVVERGGQPVAFPVFLPVFITRNWYGWAVHLFAFLNAVAEDFSRFSYAGVLSFGKEYGEWFIGFTPNIATHRLTLRKCVKVIGKAPGKIRQLLCRPGRSS
jgi:hypothetical protein